MKENFSTQSLNLKTNSKWTLSHMFFHSSYTAALRKTYFMYLFTYLSKEVFKIELFKTSLIYHFIHC